jgi:protein farnesyltransferase subunit beta
LYLPLHSTLPSPLRQTIFCTTLSWTEEVGGEKFVGGERNRLNATHPLFDLTVTHTEGIMVYFYGQPALPSRAAQWQGNTRGKGAGSG